MCICPLLLSGAGVSKGQELRRSIKSQNKLKSNKSYLVSWETGLSFDLQSAGDSVSLTAEEQGEKNLLKLKTFFLLLSSVPSLHIHELMSVPSFGGGFFF